jgi:hypothetical protein
VEIPLLLQFCIALFTGMVAATFVPPIRKSIPRLVEVGMWLALIAVCTLGVLSVSDASVRELSASALWGVNQVINTIAGLLLSGAGGWVSDHRFDLASWLVIVAGADIFTLMLLRSLREAALWRPRIRLREWVELPMPLPLAPAAEPVRADPLAAFNRRLAGAGAVLGSSMLARTTGLSNRAREAMHGGALARVADAGHTRTRARLEALRDAGDHLQFAARSWYSAVSEARKTGRQGQVIDMHARWGTQSIGGYGPPSAETAQPSRREKRDAAESQRPDSLAS